MLIAYTATICGDQGIRNLSTELGHRVFGRPDQTSSLIGEM